MKIIFFILCVFHSFSLLSAKELFTQDKILDYINISNPFVYEAIGDENVLKHKELYYQGSFDTEASLEYVKKDYPLSESQILNVGVKKLLENGTKLSVSYRDAEGVQEYNNIKTNSKGEVLAGINIPVVSLINGMNQKKLDLDIAGVNNIKLGYESKNNLRLLYHQIVSEYLEVVYYNSILKLQTELLLKAKKRKSIIEKQVELGSLAKIELLEAKQQIINREQTLLSTQNDLFISIESFVRFLNISKDDFMDKYSLQDISEIDYLEKSLKEYMDMALENRKDLQVYDLEIKKVNLKQKQTNQLNYPAIDLSLQGLYDFTDEYGYKASVSMNFPLERRKFEGENLENKFSKKNLQMKKEKGLINLETNLKNIFNNLDVLEKNIENSFEEIELVKQLEKSENKKYLMGSSNLFMLNQREIYTLEIQKKRIKYNYKYLRLTLDANKEAGVSLEVN